MLEYIVDFYCHELMLAIEIDGDSHLYKYEYDIKRQGELEKEGVVVLSSKYEGLSLSSIEGMAAGKPFVASDVPGLSDVVKDAGILFELGNSEELAKIILKLLHNKSYYDLVAKACQVRAALYDIKIMVDKHIVLYERILKK